MKSLTNISSRGCLSENGKQRTIFAFWLIIGLSLQFPLGNAWAAPEILVPPPAATIYARQPTTHLVVRQQQNDSISRTRVRKDDLLFSPQGIWQAKNGAYYLHFRLPLVPGKNSFELIPAGKNVVIKYRPLRSLLNVNFDEKGVSLFHRNELLPASCKECHHDKPAQPSKPIDEQAQPLCFECHKNIVENNWKHSPAATLQCRACHQETPDPNKITIPAGKVETSCFQCHVSKKAWLKMDHIHGPVGTGDCTVCHNPHADQNRAQLWAEGKDVICVACHTDKKDLLAEDSSTYYIHGIIKGGGCIACHSPHATDHRFQLYKPINELCVGCHTAFKDVVKGHPVGGHPVQGVKDPRRPERTFSCTSCHNPHGSDYKFLLIGDILGGQVCSQCHY
jgi:predicted CXXCH cytochrome family protein